MKKLLMSAAVLAMALASCQNEEIVSQADGMVSVKAIMGMGSRTTVSEDGTVAWSQGDKMLVYGGKTQGVLTLEGQGGDATGTFTGFVQGSVAELTTALYPAEMADADGNITLSQITYPNSNSPMVATWGETLNFNHLAGLVRVSVTGLTAETNTLSITGVGIAGTATLSNGELTGFSKGNKTVTVKGIPAGDHVIDVPVFASKTLTDVTLGISINGGEAATVETSLKIGAAQCLYLANGENGLETTDTYTGWYDEEKTEFTLRTAEDLKGLATLVNSEAGDFTGKTIKLGANIDLNNQQWTPISYKADSFTGTFDGNGYTISNLKYHSTEDDWYIGLFGGVKDATIKNVTIDNVDIDCKEGLHFAALVGDVEGNTVIENITIKGIVKIEGALDDLEVGRIAAVVGGSEKEGNFTLKNISVEANGESYVKGCSSIGGVAGQLQGKATFENCSSNIDVKGGKYFAGGIIGLAPSNATFTNCTTSGDVSIVSGRADNDNDLYRVGGIAGGWGGGTATPLVLDDCSYTGAVSGKKENGNIAEVLDCEGFVGRSYSAIVNEKVIIDGVEYVYAGNGKYNVYNNGFLVVSTLADLQAAVDAEGTEIKVALGSDIAGDLTVTQKADVNVIIDGDGYIYDGTIYIDGKNRAEGGETIELANINFETETGKTFVTQASNPAGSSHATTYAHNVTIKNCNFKAIVSGTAFNEEVSGINFNTPYNLKIEGCKAENMHSLLQAQSCNNTVVVDNIEVKNCKNGVSFGNTAFPCISNSKINSVGEGGYGIRCDGDKGRGSLKVEACEVSGENPIVVRKLTTSYSIDLSGENSIKANNDKGYQIILTNGDDGTYVTPTGTCNVTGADGFKLYPENVD